MAFGSDKVTQDILLRVNAKTGDAKRGTKDLERATGRSTEAMVKSWAKVAAGIGAIVGAARGAQAAFEEFARDQRLQAGAAGAAMDEMALSAQGLANDHELLRLASAGLNSEFKLTQQELNEVSRFMLVLRQRGVEDMTRASERLSEVIRENNVDALEEWGIHIDETSGTLEAHEAILQRIREENAKFNDEQLAMAGDEVLRNMSTLENAWRGLNILVGEGLNFVTGWIDGVIGLREETEKTLVVFRQLQALRAAASAQDEMLVGQIDAASARIARGEAGVEALGPTGGLGLTQDQIEALGQVILTGRSVASQTGEVARVERLRRESSRGGGGRGVPRAPDVSVSGGGIVPPSGGGALADPFGLGGGSIPGSGGSFRGFAAEPGTDISGLGFDPDEMRQMAETFVSFDEQIAVEKIGAIKDSFNTMGATVADVTVQMLDGQKSLAEGFESMAGRIIRSVGIQLIQRGTGALAEAAILTFTPGGQGNAAGLAAAGTAALATGTGILAVANKWGPNPDAGSGGGASAGAGSAPSVSGLGRPTSVPDGGSRNVTVVLGNEWAALSPTEQRHEWQRFQSALNEGELEGDNVSFS